MEVCRVAAAQQGAYISRGQSQSLYLKQENPKKVDSHSILFENSVLIVFKNIKMIWGQCTEKE